MKKFKEGLKWWPILLKDHFSIMRISKDQIFLLHLIKLSKTVNNTKEPSEVRLLDFFLPPIAYIRFASGDTKVWRPHETYNVFAYSANTLKIVQSFVYFKGSLLQNLADSTYIWEYKCINNEPKFKVTYKYLSTIGY